MKQFYVYILLCADGTYYVGHTDDLERRLSEHHLALCPGYTATRLPVNLVFHEDFLTRNDAFQAERQIKGWTREKKEALIALNWDRLVALSNHNKLKQK